MRAPRTWESKTKTFDTEPRGARVVVTPCLPPTLSKQCKEKKTSKPHTVYPRFKPNQQPRRARRADGSQRPHQELRWPPVSPRKTNYNCRRTVSRSSAHPELF